MKDNTKGKLNMIHRPKGKFLGKRLPGFSAKTYMIGGIIAVFGVLALALSSHSASAACAAPSTNYGSASQTISVTNTGTAAYRVWSRIMVPNTTSTSYLLEVDGGSCFTVGGNTSIPANTWTWVDYQGGVTTSKIDVSLTGSTTGINHNLKLIGNSAGLKVDRVILVTDTSCQPTGTGDNCLTTPPPPTNPPTTTLSASPTTVTQGQVVNLTASATDNASSTITKVDFYDGSTLIGSDTSSPYTLAWNTNTTTATGAHSLTAKATDAVPLTGTSNPVSVTVNAAPPADTTPPTVSLTAPSNGATLSGTTVNIAATASDNVGVTKVVFSRGTTVLATDTTAPYGLTWDSTTAADGTYNISATAYDAANNSSSSSVSVTVSNAPPPPTEAAPVVFLSAPANGAIVSGSGVTLSATATDTDSTPVAKVVFTVDGASITNGIDTTSPYSVTWNSTSVTNGNHTIMATATDTAGLSSSSQYAITVNNGDITPPSTPTNLTATASAYNKVDLSWIASTDYVGVTGYYVVRNGTTIAQTSSTSYSDTTVSANTAYTYNLYARDAAGNLSAISNSAFVTTPKQPDTQAPTWPSTGANLTATAVSTSQINLTWSAATDNVGVVSYRIFRDSGTTPIATVSTTSYGDSGLSASTTYSYTVKAVDASLNASLDSNIASATTQAVPPPPTVGNLAGNVTTISNSGNPYSCSSHPTLAKTASAPTDQTILTCNKRVQWFLNSINNAGLSVDGWFGNNTETAVKNYQTKFSLTSDGSGIVGSQTWNSLETKGAAAANNPYSCSTHPTLSKTASAPTDATILACDKRVQWFLNSLNNAGLSVDGWFGNNTETAVKNYQLKFGLTADGSGIVGSQTWNSLESKGTASVYGFGSGASVSYTSGGSQHTVTADNEGYYIMTNIVPGSYGFTYSLPNYASQTATISITSGQTATYNVTLSHL